MANNDQAIRAMDWAAGRVADVIVRRAAKRLAHEARAQATKQVRAAWKRPDAPAAAVPDERHMSFLRAPFMGTQLSRGGAIATFAAGPVFWFVADLAWAALPA